MFSLRGDHPIETFHNKPGKDSTLLPGMQEEDLGEKNHIENKLRSERPDLGQGWICKGEGMSEIETVVSKADPLLRSSEIANQTISIKNEIPQTMTIAECKTFYENQARMIDKALFESLPQGTYDQLGISYMMRKVSLYQGRAE